MIGDIERRLGRDSFTSQRKRFDFQEGNLSPGIRLGSYWAEAQAVLGALKEITPPSPGFTNAIILQNSGPGPDSLQIYTRRAVDRNGQTIPNKILIGIVHGLSPFVDVVVLEGEESSLQNASGYWQHHQSGIEYPIQNIQVIKAGRLEEKVSGKKPRGRLLVREAAWERWEELKTVYDWGAKVSRISLLIPALTVDQNRLREQSFFDFLEQSLRRSILKMSMEHEESWRIARSLINTCDTDGFVHSSREGPKPGTIEIYGAIDERRLLGKVGIVRIVSPQQVHHFIIRCRLEQENKGPEWQPFGTSRYWCSIGFWDGGWIMSRYKGRGPSPSREWYTAGQGWLRWCYTKKIEGLNIRLDSFQLPPIPPHILRQS